MRGDAPPPTAPSASSSSPLFGGGGGEFFESAPGPLVFLPLLLIQGGGMDLSRVGEKLLSSVRSARSLGLLPPTPSPSSSRPEVPARAAAAAAAARAIAGLPPHERISLPSNSEDLVSIYGSNPQGQAVDELDDVFYEEEFDPIKHILENIPDEGGDSTYFDKQSTLRLAQLDKIAERLSHHVMGHHEEMVKGMQLVMELEQDLKVANVICMNGRRHISSSKNEVSRDLVVNVKSKKKQALLDVLPILTELRHALDMQMELETFVEKENYFQAFQLLPEYLQILENYSGLSAVQEMGRGIEAWLARTIQKLDTHLLGVCQTFNEERYLTVIDAYALMGDIGGMAEKMQSFFLQEVLSQTHFVLKDMLEEEVGNNTQRNRFTYSDLCVQVPESKLRPCLLKTLESLFSLMCSYYAIMSFCPGVNNNTSQSTSETLVDSGRGHSSAVGIQDGFAAEKSDRTSSSDVSNPDASTSGTDSPFYQLRADATKLVAHTFERGRRNLWQLATSRLSVLLSCSAVCSTSTYQFLKNYEDLTIFILAGEAFCGFEASEFRQKLKTVCLNYVVTFHRQNIYALKMVLEKESWTIMSAEASQIISLAGLTGDGAALISPTSCSSTLPIHCYRGNSTTADTGKQKNGFASWLKIENPFSWKLENGSTESPKSNVLFNSAAGNSSGLGRPLLSLVLQMASKLDQSSSAEPRLRQPKPPVSPSLAPKVSIFGAKAGFVIPKNKLAGSLVVRGGAKNETPTASSKEENNKYVQRKTKWGPDLTLYSAVRKARALAYQTRVEQITKELNSGALEIGGNEGSMSAAKASNSDGTDNLKENEQGKLELLELEKQEIIGEILQLNPGYKAPDDYKPLLKETKIPLPTKAHPRHNIIGVLIGPDSNTQKRLQEETGANIQVYGTNKANGEEGEVRLPDIYESQAAYEDLYINVSADSYDKIDAAVALIELLLTPVSVNSADTSATATVSPAVTSGSVNPAGVQQVQSATSQPGLLQYQSHSAHWLSTPQTNCPSIPSSGPMLSPLPNNSLHLQPPVGSFSMPPYTGQPPHMNIMPRSPLPVPGPQPSMPNIEQPLPQFQANPSIGPPFGRASGFVTPQPVLSSSGPLSVRPLQTPHASGGWPTFSPVTAQSQRPSQAATTFMPVRPPISFSPIGATPPLQGAVPSVPSQSNFSTSYGIQHSPGANFAPSATLPSRPPGGPQSFPSVSLQGPSSVQVLSSPAGASPWSPYPLSMQMRPPMSTPAQMRGPPSPFPQVGPTPGMAQMVPSLRPPATLGMPGLSPSASASTSYGQTSIAALRPPHTATGDFTFRPLVSPSPAPDLPASASQMGTQANTHLGLPQAPLFRPGNQSPIAPVQGFHTPVDGSLMGQPRVHAPPCFPGAVPRNPAALQSPTGFRAFPPAVQPGVPTISPPMPPSNPSNSLPPRPFHFLPPQQNPFPNTNRQGGNPGGANPIYDPFAPTTISGAKKADVDPEYEDLMASVGVK